MLSHMLNKHKAFHQYGFFGDVSICLFDRIHVRKSHKGKVAHLYESWNVGSNGFSVRNCDHIPHSGRVYLLCEFSYDPAIYNDN